MDQIPHQGQRPDRLKDPQILEIATRYGLVKDGRFPYEVNEVGGLRFIVDAEKPDLDEGEVPVYPYHDEGADILELVKDIFDQRKRVFSTCIDSFSGGGHSGLPILHAGIAEKLIGHDINPRAVRLAQANAALNEMPNTVFSQRSVTESVEPSEGNTLYIANPPFALRAQGTTLPVYRDGGDNALVLLRVFLHGVMRASQPGDVICGVLMSRGMQNTTEDGRDTVEAAALLDGILDQYGGRGSVSLYAGRKIYRGFNGKKEQDNPMPIDLLYLKADPNDPEDVRMWKEESERQKAQGVTTFGYYHYTIYR